MIYQVTVDGEEVIYGSSVIRSRYPEKTWSAICHEIVKQNFPDKYPNYKDDEFVISIMASQVDLSERYEDLLELLPQTAFSKAGTHPKWVADEVDRRTLDKGITQEDVSMIVEDNSEDIKQLTREIESYFGLTPEYYEAKRRINDIINGEEDAVE